MKMWEIREGYDPDEPRMGMRGGDESDMAYEEGCRHGYRKGYADAMRESHGDMGFRDSGYSRSGMSDGSGRYGYGRRMMYPPYVNFRDEDEDMDTMNERRRRDSRGRYM